MVLLGVLTLVTPQQAFALGTASGTQIDNSATIDYDVGGFSQAQITSPTASFDVDNKVDVVVATTDGAAVTASPGTTLYDLEFTVRNDGNTTQSYALSATAVLTGSANAFAGTDVIDMTNVVAYVETGGGAGYQAGTDDTFIASLAPDATVTVYISADLQASATNGDYASYHLLVTTAVAGTDGGTITTESAGGWDDTLGVVQVVFADGQGTDTANEAATPDGMHSSQSDYIVASAVLAITKSVNIISDPFNGTTNPIAIPGAVMEYTIVVTNNGGVIADSVLIEDLIPGTTEFVVGTETSNGTFDYSNGTWGYTPSVTAPDISDEFVTAVSVLFADIDPGGDSETTTFQVEIK